MISRIATRESWREYETQEEIDEAIELLRMLDKRTDLSMLDYADLLTYGKTGSITGCECYILTAQEKADADAALVGRRHRETSLAWAMTRKKTKFKRQSRSRLSDMDIVNLDHVNEKQEKFEVPDDLGHPQEQHFPELLNDQRLVSCVDSRTSNVRTVMNEQAGSSSSAFQSLRAILSQDILDDFDAWYESGRKVSSFAVSGSSFSLSK